MGVMYASQPGAGSVGRAFRGPSGITSADVVSNLSSLQEVMDPNAATVNVDRAGVVAINAAQRGDMAAGMKELVQADIAAAADTGNKFAAADPMAQLNMSSIGFMSLASSVLPIPIPDFGALKAAVGLMGAGFEGQGSHVTTLQQSSFDVALDDDGDGSVSAFEQTGAQVKPELMVASAGPQDDIFGYNSFADDQDLGRLEGMLVQAEQRAALEQGAAEAAIDAQVVRLASNSFADGLDSDPSVTSGLDRGVAEGYSPPTGEMSFERRSMPQPGLA